MKGIHHLKVSELFILGGVYPVMCCLSGTLVWDQSGKAVQVLQATCGRTGSLLRLLLHFGLSPQGYTGETNKNCFKNELGSTYSKVLLV